MFRLESWLIPLLLTSTGNLKGCTDNCSREHVPGTKTSLQETNKILNFYRTHRAPLLLYRVEHPPMLSTYYYYSNVFFTRTFLPKELTTEQIISTCILVKFLKLQRVRSSNKREKYHSIFSSISKRYPSTVPRHKHKHKKPKTLSERVY